MKRFKKSLFILRLILLIVGFYFEFIKAGIPYQDPPKELLIKYNRNLKIGTYLSRARIILEIIYFIISVISKKVKIKLNKPKSQSKKDWLFNNFPIMIF